MSKKCFKCGIVKPLSDFYKHKQMSDGTMNKCKECAKKDTKNNYRKNLEHYKEYEITRGRTPERYISHTYYRIKSRSTMKNNREYCVYGREYLSREEWDKFCEDTMEIFMEKFNIWKESGYQRRLAPSIDRIDSTKPYVLGNLQWLHLFENSKKFTS